MKSQKLSTLSRIILFICSLALVAVLFVPMWRIDLDAPQYPEGLMLQIFPNKLGGNVEIINGLNHYIGMKTLHTEDFIEFKVLPVIIIVFAVAFALVALMNKRRWVNILFIVFVLFGIVAMIDFWRWEYNYGHNLDPNAAIVVPGMAYQPPLIGFKQLLNFGAYSIPDTGGWLFVSVGVLLMAVVYIEFRRSKSATFNSMASVFIFALGLVSLSSCSSAPDPVQLGKDPCHFCKMTISDARFATSLLTTKGKTYKFDDMRCMLDFTKSGILDAKDIRQQYVADFAGDHSLVPVEEAVFLYSNKLRSPMGGNYAAFQSKNALQEVQKTYPGEMLSFAEILKK